MIAMDKGLSDQSKHAKKAMEKEASRPLTKGIPINQWTKEPLAIESNAMTTDLEYYKVCKIPGSLINELLNS